MRHIAFYFGIAAALVASCSIQEDNFIVPEPGNTVFHARFEQPAEEGTKVYVNEDLQLRWTAEDRVSVFNKTTANQEYIFAGQTGDGEGDFNPVDNGQAGTGNAIEHVVSVYPYQDASIADNEAVTLTLPAVQAYAANSFGPEANTMVSVTADEELLFKNVGGFLKLSLYGEGVKVSSITLKGNKGEKIAGNATVTMPLGGVPSVSMASDATTSITLNCAEPVALGATAAESVDFWFVVPPVEFKEGFTVNVVHQGGMSVKTTDKDIIIVRNKLSKMAPVEVKLVDTRTYRITNMWLWGGTGAQYGSSKKFDLLTVPDFFNKDDGRGIEALKDNYYQLRPDGTFVNYAGEDGRNWWFIYSGSMNPESGKDLDLSKFYDVLPLSEGTYSISGSTVTFTRPDNTTSTATFVGPGSYMMPNTNPAIYVNIEHQALKFTITGGVEDWKNYIYKDYHRIAINPHLLYIELEQLPDGFIVPEASRTTDADFKNDPAFNLTDLPGTWKVYGGSVSVGGKNLSYGFFVLGGSGGVPAFVAPIEKSWCWDGSVKYESDNELTITPTSMTSTEVKGTTNWTSGADGKFWNYLFNTTTSAWSEYYGTDLSQYYDQIPKGTSAFTLDVATMTVTLGNEHQAKLLTPGSYSFQGASNNPLVIPNSCFALQFHLQDSPVPVTSYQYKDIDRFLFAPLEYYIIFEKVE